MKVSLATNRFHSRGDKFLYFIAVLTLKIKLQVREDGQCTERNGKTNGVFDVQLGSRSVMELGWRMSPI
jgi:hypothetical protein